MNIDFNRPAVAAQAAVGILLMLEQRQRQVMPLSFGKVSVDRRNHRPCGFSMLRYSTFPIGGK